jgi:hypothetical protein
VRARTRLAVRWTPSGRPVRGARRGGLQGALEARGASGNAGHGRLGGPARRGAVRCGAARDVLVCQRLTAFFPKILNRSAQSGK